MKLRIIADKFTEIIGINLHYFEKMEKLDIGTCTAKEITDLQDGWLYRYQNDRLFHNKVDSTVASLLQALTKEDISQ